jgi:hypothetical protein
MFEEVEICFMIPGHTKFSVDGFFGIAKNKLYDILAIETFEEMLTSLKNGSEKIKISTPSTKYN